MDFKVNFKENNNSFNSNFGEIHKVSDGGYDKGYNDGYDKGYQTGYGESYDKGFDKGFIDGKQAEYDRFWDSYQENGNRRDYDYGFAGRGWCFGALYPKYPIKFGGSASYTFATLGGTANATYLSGVLDFVEMGIELDFSDTINAIYTFQYARAIKRLGVLDFTNCENMNRTFYACNVETIDEFKVSEKTQYNHTFDYAGKLTSLTVSGTIANNGFSLTSAKNLNHDSLISIINALSTTTNNLSVALSLTAVNKAFETSEGANDGSNSAEWQTLVATKTNWTINLS